MSAFKQPERAAVAGRFAALEPVDPGRHADGLFAAIDGNDSGGALWRYMPYGPWQDRAAFAAWLAGRSESTDPLFFAIVPKGESACGMLSFMRTDTAHGSTEIGHVWFAPSLQRSAAATEAVFLALSHAFEAMGMRRVEWKCDRRNAASRRAAERLGFAYEGCFRQHMIMRGEIRDTCWYAMLAEDWQATRAGFEAWLDDANFAAGRQRRALRALIMEQRAAGQGAADLPPLKPA